MEEQQNTPPQEPQQEVIPQEDLTPPKQSHAHKNHMPMLLGVVAALFVIAAAAIGLLYLNEDKDEQQSQPVAQQTQETETTEINPQEGETVWDEELEQELQAYDETNDNVTYAFTDEAILVTGNGLPDHDTGQFPNPGNPNTISEQDVSYSVPRKPTMTDQSTDVRVFGITLGGIKIEPGTAERDQETGWSIEAFNSGVFDPGVDDNNAHVQPDGTYHYHGVPSAVVTTPEDEHSNLIGFAADGFPIYAVHGYLDPADSSSRIVHLESSWQLKDGERADGEPSGSYNGDYTQDYEYVAGSGDLDECNGRFTVTPEFPNGTYAYYFTETFPYAGRCVMGEVSESFAQGAGGTPPQGGNDQQGQPGQPPQGPPPSGAPPQ